MSRRARLLLLLAPVLASIALLSRLERDRPASAPSPPEHNFSSSPLRPAVQTAGRQAVEPDRSWVAAAREILGPGGREHACGPYRLLTDAEPARWRPLCEGVASELEATYSNRLGVQPVGAPLGTILLFARREDFRSYVANRTGLPRGYAGFSRASRGIVALVTTDSLDSLARTLAHEIAHLLHRRTFGPNLPPWLAEGLADAVGDTASATGIGPLVGISGADAVANRLVAALETAELRPPSDLLVLSRTQFDEGILSYDYEQSALFVRFLLLDAELGDLFRQFLHQLASGTPYRPADLTATLGIPITTLEAKFEHWLLASIESH